LWVGILITWQIVIYRYFANSTDRWFYTIPLAAFISGSHRKRARELLKQEKFDPVELLNLIGGKSRIKGKSRAFASVNNVLASTYKTVATSKREMLISDNSIRMFPVEHPLGNKYFYGYGRTYFVNYFNF
jgi:hypothetical protein